MKPILAHLLLCATPLAADVFERGVQQMMCHRTANRDVPENTLASLEESARLGCNIVELDIARSLDGQLVLLHDGPIDRISSGSGIVEQIVADELFLSDAGTWMNPRFAGLKAPLFADALRTARQTGLRLVLDYKSAGIHPQVAPLLTEEGMAARVRFPGASLADLYDPLTMPPDLLKAHQRLDAAVDRAYLGSGGRKTYRNDAERVAFLFELYQRLTSLLPASAPPKARTRQPARTRAMGRREASDRAQTD